MADESINLSGAVDMLKGMLSGEEGQQQLQNILGMLKGSPDANHIPGESTGGIDPENLEMMLKLQRAMSAMNNQKSNSQAQLLMALKPFLKPSRREKVDSAMKMLKFTSLIEIMKDVQED